MENETLRKIVCRAIVVLLTILILLGVIYENDKSTQWGNTDEALRDFGEAQAEETLPRPAGSTGSGSTAYRYEEGITGIAKAEHGATGGDTPVDKSGFSECPDNEGEQETYSLSLLPGGDGSRGLDYVDSSNDINPVEFKITWYTAGYESTGKRPGDPAYGITYSGAEVRAFHTIAADPKVLPIGTVVQIVGIPGVYVVEDIGSGVKGNHIDIYTPDLAQALKNGVQYRKVIILK